MWIGYTPRIKSYEEEHGGEVKQSGGREHVQQHDYGGSTALNSDIARFA